MFHRNRYTLPYLLKRTDASGKEGDGKESGCFCRAFRFALGRGGGLLLFQLRGCFGPVFQQQFFLAGVMAVPGVVQHGNRSPAYGVDVGVVLNEQAGNLRFSLDAGSVVPGGRGRSGPLRWRRLLFQIRIGFVSYRQGQVGSTRQLTAEPSRTPRRSARMGGLERVGRVSHMGQMTLSEFQVSPFLRELCVQMLP